MPLAERQLDVNTTMSGTLQHMQCSMKSFATVPDAVACMQQCMCMQMPSTSAHSGEATQLGSDGEVDQTEASFKEAAARLKKQQAEAAMPIEDRLNL